MNSARRILSLAGILVGVAASISALSIHQLYTAAYTQQRLQLQEMAATQARLIGSFASHGLEHPQGSLETILNEIIGVLDDQKGFGQTGEFLLGAQLDGKKTFRFRQRADSPATPVAIHDNEQLSEPMRAALAGESGVMEGIDYRGMRVLAAYERIPGMNLGVVAKIDLEELNRPYVRAGQVVLGLGAAIILAGVLLFIRGIKPVLLRMRENEDNMRAMAENAHDGILVNLEGRHVYANRRLTAILGYTDGEIINTTINDLVASDELPGVMDRYTRRIRGEEPPSTYQTVFLTRNGERIPVELSTSKTRWQGRLAVLVVVRDLRERMQAVEALMESERALARAQEVAHIGSWSWDVADDRVTWSDQLYSIFGLQRNVFEPSRENFLKCVHPDDREHVAHTIMQSRNSGQPFSYYYRVVRPDGVERILHGMGEATVNDAGEVVKLFGTTQDVTEYEEFQERVRETNEELSAILRNMQDMFFRIDDSGRVTRISDSVRDLLGFAPKEVRGGFLADYFVDVSGYDNLLRRLESGDGEARNYECRMRHRSGASVWVQSNVRYTLDAQGNRTGVEGTARDITDRKNMEDELVRANQIFAAVFDSTHVMVAYMDTAFNFLMVNRAYAQDDGKAPDWFLGRNHFDLYPSEENREIFRRVVHSGEPYFVLARPFEYTLNPEKGVTHWDWNLVPVKDIQGKVTGLILTLLNVTERIRAIESLHESEGRFRSTFEQAAVGVAHVSPQGRWLRVNRKLCDIIGYTADELLEKTFQDITHPDDIPPGVESVRRMLAGDVSMHDADSRFLRRDGSVTWVHLTVALVRDTGDEPAYFICVIEDINERRRATEEMRKLSSALQQTADSILITDRKGIIEYVNDAFEQITGYSRAEAIGRRPNLLKSGKQGPEFYKKLWETLLAGSVFNDIFINRKKDGVLYYEERTITPLKNPDGTITHFVSTGKDITERIEAQKRLQYLADHDTLTELPNRMLFMDRLKQSLARARWHNHLVSVLFVDLDRFKNINDTLGHDVGDRLLQQLSLRFSTGVRDGDTVARLGGDEFAILLEDVASEKDVVQVAKKILNVLSEPFLIDEHDLFITASIGISLYPGDSEEAQTLLKQADIAMYRAKDMGKNTYQFYSADMSERTFEHLMLESSLRRALEREEFRLYYQPQIDTASGMIQGVEALLRWQRPGVGLVPPADFIPLLEETGLIVPVGEWVLRTALKQARAWHDAGWKDLRISINVSPRQFTDQGFIDMVEEGVVASGGRAELLELEITESVIMQHRQRTADAMNAFSRLGVRLAIDDFGTGYSSLGYLRKFPIDTLKIDQSFVRDIMDDDDDASITAAIIVMAHSLKLDVIAEGVESREQMEYLRLHGCSAMQGFLFSRPLPPEEVTQLLTSQYHAGWPVLPPRSS